MKISRIVGVCILAFVVLPLVAAPTPKLADNLAVTAHGVVEGTYNPATKIRSFKGVPFAAPPVGDLRWKPPQPAKDWEGVRSAKKFGPRAMQRPIFSDMVFRSDGMSEDCLYLNVWTPANSAKERLPVLVYFYGGGFTAGDGSESRYDGESIAKQDIVAVTVNYRLNVFGFLAHPELTEESPEHASGNYGLLDQVAALRWVQANIAAFGGNPKRVTIGGESAGSSSVCALMASPLSRDLIAGAIGESGSVLGEPQKPLPKAEESGLEFATNIGAMSLKALRAMSAEDLLAATAKSNAPKFSVVVDGYFLPAKPLDIFTAGKQAHVPLLAGWNSEEGGASSILKEKPPTVANYEKAVGQLYTNHASAILELYPATTPEEVLGAARDLASDRFTGFSTWRWVHLQGRTGHSKVFRYYYAHPRPAMKSSQPNTNRPRGAVHSAEIEYALGNLDGNKVYSWVLDDYRISDLMQDYFANFVKNGDPNGRGLPSWPPVNRGRIVQYLRIDTRSRVEPDNHLGRYLLLEQIANDKSGN